MLRIASIHYHAYNMLSLWCYEYWRWLGKGFFREESFKCLNLSPLCYLFSSAHTGMYHAAYSCVLSSLPTADLQRAFCIAPDPICTPPPAAAPCSFEPVCPFTASAPTHGEYLSQDAFIIANTTGCFKLLVSKHLLVISLISLYRG